MGQNKQDTGKNEDSCNNTRKETKPKISSQNYLQATLSIFVEQQQEVSHEQVEVKLLVFLAITEC